MRLIACLGLLFAVPAKAQGLYAPPADKATMRSQMASMQPQLAQQAMVAQKDVMLDASGNATWDYSAVGFTKTPAVVRLAQAMDTSMLIGW